MKDMNGSMNESQLVGESGPSSELTFYSSEEPYLVLEKRKWIGLSGGLRNDDALATWLHAPFLSPLSPLLLPPTPQTQVSPLIRI